MIVAGVLFRIAHPTNTLVGSGYGVNTGLYNESIKSHSSDFTLSEKVAVNF